jgi:vancomycin aglycone glucosyltransferase
MRVLLSTCGQREAVEPMVGLAMQLGALDGQVQVCAPPDFAEPLAGVGVPLVLMGQPVRPPVTKAAPDLPPRPRCSPPVRHRRRGGRGIVVRRSRPA